MKTARFTVGRFLNFSDVLVGQTTKLYTKVCPKCIEIILCQSTGPLRFKELLIA